MSVRLSSVNVARGGGKVLPDELQHQQLVKIGIQQGARNGIQLPVMVVRAPGQVNNHVNPTLIEAPVALEARPADSLKPLKRRPAAMVERCHLSFQPAENQSAAQMPDGVLHESPQSSTAFYEEPETSSAHSARRAVRMSRLREWLAGGLLISDGAWGTELQARGLPSGVTPDTWNLTHADRVEDVARAYVEAGSQVILTNTFRANHVAMQRLLRRRA